MEVEVTYKEPSNYFTPEMIKFYEDLLGENGEEAKKAAEAEAAERKARLAAKRAARDAAENMEE